MNWMKIQHVGLSLNLLRQCTLTICWEGNENTCATSYCFLYPDHIVFQTYYEMFVLEFEAYITLGWHKHVWAVT